METPDIESDAAPHGTSVVLETTAPRAARGEPGADSHAPLTPAVLDSARRLFGEVPRFWGRIYPTESGPEDNALLHAAGIRVLPVARPGARARLGRAEGLVDGEAAARDLVAQMGKENLTSQGGTIFMFLAVEPGLSLSAEYFIGWAAGLACAPSPITLAPGVRVTDSDARTAKALWAAAREGVSSQGLWIINRPGGERRRRRRAPLRWRADEARLIDAPACPVLLWQHASEEQGSNGFDALVLNPALDLEGDLLAHLPLPPATPEVPIPPAPVDPAPAPPGPVVPPAPRPLTLLGEALASRWSFVFFLGGTLGMIAIGLFPRLRGGFAWGIEAALLAAMIALIGVAITGRAPGVLIDARKRMSLSRFQMVLWTLILLSAYVTIVARRMSLPHPLDVEIDWRLFALMGISTTTLLSAPALERGKIESGLLRENATVEEAWWSDMFGKSDDGRAHEVDLNKLQMFCLTLVAALSYGISLYHLLDGTAAAEITSFPALGDGLLAILGLSHAGYLGGKLSKAAPAAEPASSANSPSPSPSPSPLPVPVPVPSPSPLPVPSPSPSPSTDTPPSTPVRRHLIPARQPGAITGSAFFARLGDTQGKAREDAAKEQLLAGNIPSFLRDFVELELVIEGHRASVWVSPDVLAIGSDDDFVRMPLSPLTAQEVHDVYRTTFVTTRLADQIHAQAEVRLAAIDQSAWHPFTGDPGPGMLTNAFYLEHHRRVEAARGAARRGALTSTVKKDVCLSIKLNAPPSEGHLGRDSVVLHGWYRADGTPWQHESDAHPSSYADYSHGIRLVSTDMVVDGAPMSLFDVLESKELAPLLLPLADVRSPAFPPPRRYPGAPLGGLLAREAARVELSRGAQRHGKGAPWAVRPNSGPIVDDYQRSAGILDADGNWALAPAEAPWCGNFCGYCFRQAGFDMEGDLPGRLNAAGNVPGQKKLIFWSAQRLDHYFKHREGCRRLELPSLRTRMTPEECVAWLRDHLHPFGLRPGDLLLCTTRAGHLAHVAMVASYDPMTHELVTYEGNYRRRGAAVRWDLAEPGVLGFHRVDVVGRLPDSDFARDPRITAGAGPIPEIESGELVSGRHADDSLSPDPRS